MLIYTLQIDASDCVDCIEKGVKGDWPNAIACAITLAITAIIRHFEKKHMRKKHKRNADLGETQ